MVSWHWLSGNPKHTSESTTSLICFHKDHNIAVAESSYVLGLNIHKDKFSCLITVYLNIPPLRAGIGELGIQISLRLDTLQTRWQVRRRFERPHSLSVATILWRASRLAKFKHAHSRCDTMWELCSNVLAGILGPYFPLREAIFGVGTKRWSSVTTQQRNREISRLLF